MWWISTALAVDWAAALATGDCATVVTTLTEPKADVEKLALGRCLLHAGDATRADETLTDVTGDLAPWAKLVRGEALIERGRPADAVTVLAGVAISGPQDELLRGHALVAAGRSTEAREGLNALLETSVGDEARYWLAAGAWDRGEKDAAISTWRTAWTKTPTSVWADRAAERLATAGAPVPDYTTAEGRALAMARAKTLLAQKQAGLAIELLNGIHAQDPFETDAEERYYAEALFDAKAYDRAADWFGRCGGSAAGAGVAFRMALATARAGNYEGAKPLYAKVVSMYPGTAEADEAAWKPAYMDHDAGKLPEAIDGFSAYLKGHPGGKFAADARWLQAWDHYRLGHTEDARKGFDKVLATDAGETAAAAAYWKARLTDDLPALREVLRVYPNTSYAWFAADRLDVRYPAVAEPTRPDFPAGWVEARPQLATALTLVRGGMADWGRPLLAKFVAEAKGAQATALPMAWALLDAEDYAGAKAIGCAYNNKWTCTPRPHLGAVRAIAAEQGLDPLLPYAIMNAESGLDPSVTSPAGARGLMQLMPALAKTLAVDRVADFAVDDLYRAGVNARLGTTELGLLHARFRNAAVQPNLPLVIAGYNGGAEAVERWLGTYAAAPDADRFAEDISFTETRRYVRRVLGYLMGYRRVYGDG